MDNFTHSLVGWALGQTGLKRRSRKGLAALVLGANMPDIDVFFGWVPWAPLSTHRGVTHALTGGVLWLPPVLAGLLWLLDRWQMRRGAVFRSGLEMHFGWLVVLAYLGTLTHPLLDWQNTYAVQLLSPFSNRWFHNDSLFIIDVWVWSGLAFAIWLSRRREKQDSAHGGHWKRPPRVALALLVAYIAGNGALSASVKSEVRRSVASAEPDAIFASPAPVLAWRRDVVWRENDAIGFGQYDPLRRAPNFVQLAGLVPDGMGDPLVPPAMTANDQVIDFLRWSVMTTASVERENCRAIVTFSDARYAGRVGGGFRHAVELPLTRSGCPPQAAG